MNISCGREKLLSYIRHKSQRFFKCQFQTPSIIFRFFFWGLEFVRFAGFCETLTLPKAEDNKKKTYELCLEASSYYITERWLMAQTNLRLTVNWLKSKVQPFGNNMFVTFCWCSNKPYISHGKILVFTNFGRFSHIQYTFILMQSYN